MQREFGKRVPKPPVRQAAGSQPTPEAPESPAVDPTHMRQAMLAIVLTVTIVGGMFLVPRLAQCDGRQGAFGLDWCRLMKATLMGAVQGVAAGNGARVSR